jgi:dTMP kinase
MAFIVIEGIDGSGGETQTKLLKEFFERKGKKAIRIESPDPSTPVGEAYKMYLDEKFRMENDAIFLLCACDVIINRPLIEKAEKENKLVIADRYITSTIAYQGANGFPFEKALKLVELMKFPKADVIIFIDISPEVSMERKRREKGELDKHEKNIRYLTETKKFYKKEIERNVLGKWFVINGGQDIQAVHKEIIKIVEREIESLK